MNLPNKITISRVLMIPVFLFFLLTNFIESPLKEWIAAGIFIVTSLTDALDGYIARKRKQITNFGKFMDPIADKLLVTAALISLVEMGLLRSWMVIIIIAREFIVSALRLIAVTEGVVIAASWWGKIKTNLQIFAIVALLLDKFFTNQLQWFFYIYDIQITFGTILMWLAVLSTIQSGVDYVYKNKKILNMENT